uniref:Major facilitator superfamily (MFS) profile domain-containing protein n=1 Tax=Plectus sambesii TaxID=2011161 RepID=A0A914XR49_9BILA
MALGRLNITPFHCIVFAIWQLGLLFGGQQIFPIFFNYEPKWTCEGYVDDDLNKDGICSKSEKCELFTLCTENITFEQTPFHSIVEEFDLLCGPNAYYATIVSSFQFAGVLVGTVVYGHVGDHFGRKPVSIFGLTVGILFACASGLSPSWLVYALLRFVVGSSVGCVLVVVYTYVVELILPEQRIFLRAFFNWGFGRVIFTFICYLLPNWRWASAATALVALPAIPLIAFIPESPIWYESKKRYKEMREAQQKIARIGGKRMTVQLPTKDATIEKRQSITSNPQKIYSMKDLATNRRLAGKTAVLSFLWFTASLSSYASDLNSGNLGGDFYENQFLMGALIGISKMLIFLLDTYVPRFSRRLLHQISQALVILTFAAIMVILIWFASPNDRNCAAQQSSNINVLVVAINILGVVLIEYTWDACYLCGAEGFPTELRAIGVGTCSL